MSFKFTNVFLEIYGLSVRTFPEVKLVLCCIVTVSTGLQVSGRIFFFSVMGTGLIHPTLSNIDTCPLISVFRYSFVTFTNQVLVNYHIPNLFLHHQSTLILWHKQRLFLGFKTVLCHSPLVPN